MRISRLAFKNVGPFEEAIFEFPEPEGPGELVLFEGPNGSGKTTVVEAIAILAVGDKPQAFGAPIVQFIRRLFLDREVDRGSVDADVVHDSAHAQFHWHTPITDGSFETTPAAPEGQTPFASLPRLWERSIQGTELSWAAFSFGGHQKTASLATDGPRSIEEQPLAGALSFGQVEAASTRLGQLLTNLENERTKASTYARERAHQDAPHDLERLAASREEAIRRFERAFSHILARRVTIEFAVSQHAPIIRFDGEAIPLGLLGEGMRNTFSWLSNLLVRLERIRWADQTRSPLDQDFWLILDEIDESLHPTLQARILPALRRLLPNARIYATTHSPFVVASVGEGTVFSIRPDADRRVRGKVTARRLEPGQTLELVTSEIFNAPSEFVDTDTREKLEQHERDIRALERHTQVDWSVFFARRLELMKRNDEVRTVVSMQELPVRQEIQRKLREQEDGPTA